jgi:flagellar L-ring protein FlgH
VKLSRLKFAPLFLLAGCATDVRDIGREPHMTPVGAGIESLDDQVPVGPMRTASLGRGMRLDDNRLNMYRDMRAMTVGDVVTINIAIDDKATIGNSTDRSRDSKVKSAWAYTVGLLPDLFADGTPNMNASGSFTNNIESNTSTQGKGQINRSEQIRLSVAAVVTAVLPNGNLILKGSQEIRVNFELRVLTVAGIARPRDILKDNTIAYDKIAEARISYGGRGRLSEVQQPAIGQQWYDTLFPF